MSICVALGMMLGRGIQAFYIDIKQKRKTKQQQKREEQRISEQSHGSARFQPAIQTESPQSGDYEHPEGGTMRNSDYGHDGRNNLFAHRTVVPSPLQTLDWLNTEVVDPLEDTPPIYDPNATRLPPYDPNSTGHGSCSQRGRRRRRGGSRRHDETNLAARYGEQINEAWQPRARACTGMRISEDPGLDIDQGGAVIWYDALEDRYEVISRSLAPPTEPPLPPPYMPNCVEDLLI